MCVRCGEGGGTICYEYISIESLETFISRDYQEENIRTGTTIIIIIILENKTIIIIIIIINQGYNKRYKYNIIYIKKEINSY